MESRTQNIGIASIIDQPLHILVVDDDPIQGLYSETFLGSDTTRIETAVSAEEGLQKLARTEFDFILLDYDMPGMNGVEFVKAARAINGGLKPPIMLVTQHRDPAIGNAAYEAGVCHVFHKPVDWRLLAQMVKYYVTEPAVRRGF